MTKKDLIILILAIAIGFAVCWFFFRPKPDPNPVNLQPLIEKREDVIKEIERLDTVFKAIEINIEIEHEKIDTLSSTDGLRDATANILARARR